MSATRKVLRWNYGSKCYEEVELPANWNMPMLADNDEIVNCAECGKALKFGDTYTSMRVHSDNGFGYPVCPECYEEEWQERKCWEQSKRHNNSCGYKRSRVRRRR